MVASVVDGLYEEFKALDSYLEKAKEITLRNTANETFRKALLVAAGSHFEIRFKVMLLEFFEESTSHHELTVNFIKNKALQMQFHTFFDWNASNANQFFSLFGKGFCDHMKRQVANDPGLDKSVRAFMEICSERNRLVHQDFASYSLEKTSDEIYLLYQQGVQFLEVLPAKLNDFKTDGSGDAAE